MDGNTFEMASSFATYCFKRFTKLSTRCYISWCIGRSFIQNSSLCLVCGVCTIPVCTFFQLSPIGRNTRLCGPVTVQAIYVKLQLRRSLTRCVLPPIHCHCTSFEIAWCLFFSASRLYSPLTSLHRGAKLHPELCQSALRHSVRHVEPLLAFSLQHTMGRAVCHCSA